MDHLLDDSDRLKPCPFCGSGASAGCIDTETQDHPDEDGRFIACDTCGASTGLRFACGEDPMPLLMEQWNKRSDIDQRRARKAEDLLRELAQVCTEVNDHTAESWRRAVLRIGNDATIALRPND